MSNVWWRSTTSSTSSSGCGMQSLRSSGGLLVRKQQPARVFAARTYARKAMTKREKAAIRSKRVPYIETKKYLNKAGLPDVNPIFGRYTPFVRKILVGLGAGARIPADAPKTAVEKIDGAEKEEKALELGYGLSNQEPDMIMFAIENKKAEERFASAREQVEKGVAEVEELYAPVIQEAKQRVADAVDADELQDARDYLAEVEATQQQYIDEARKQPWKDTAAEDVERGYEHQRQAVNRIMAITRADADSWRKGMVKNAVKEFGMDSLDSGSAESQAAVMTVRIVTLAEHVRVNKKDNSATRRLTMLIQQRNSMLKYLKKKSIARYMLCITRLGLDDAAITKEFRFSRKLLGE
ncbi:hypothetical protein BZA70DRAFT_282381 [Myxozyma melibiosi]|uniref:Ribosomal protein S15 n=1 Tax=Myxozyma melibiosi TaxID=54550 RepID=A0ABR1F229_9ASCO